MSSFRYVAVQPDRAARWKGLRSAFALHDLLTDLQCDASGRVNYGRAFGYAWLRARWPGNPDHRPCIRTLKYHMAKLKGAGLVDVRVVGFGGGMVVRLLGSAKWQNERPLPAEQIPLFAPRVAQIRGRMPVDKPVEKPVEKLRKSTVSNFHMGQDLAPVGGKLLPRKEVKNLSEETIKGIAVAHALPRVGKTPKELDERRRLLLDQAEMLKRKFKIS